MRKTSTSGGFTIIEITIVLALIALVTAIALPRAGGAVSSHEMEMFAQNMVSDIRLVQQINMNSGTPQHSMYFSTEKNGQKYYLINGGGFNLKKVYLPQNINWNSLPKTIRFYENGMPSSVPGGHSAQTIELKNSSGKVLYIKIAVSTGRVRIDKAKGNDE